MCTKVVYQDVSMVKLTVPYIPSFLGFREADIFCEMVLSLELTMPSCWTESFQVSRQKSKEPAVTPGVLMVDGNGLLHPRYVIFIILLHNGDTG